MMNHHIVLCGGTLDFRRDLNQVLSHVPSIDSILEVATHREALRLALHRKPDILFLKDRLKKTAKGPVRDLAGAGVKVIVCADAVDDDRVLNVLRCGGYGVIDRWDDPAVLSRLVGRVSTGEAWVSRKILSMLLESARSELRRGDGNTPPPSLDSVRHLGRSMNSHPIQDAVERNPFGLTRRQADIVRFVVAGLTNREIAARFSISENTVKHHLRVIFDKVGVHNRLELATFAAHHGLSELPSASARARNRPSPAVK